MGPFVPSLPITPSFGETFDVTGSVIPINPPSTVAIGPAEGQYSLNVFTNGAGNTLAFNFTHLVQRGLIGDAGPKLFCDMAAASPVVPQPLQNNNTYLANRVINSFGFYRKYGGWWQVIGGSVHANTTVQSTIPASVQPRDTYLNQRLILGDGSARDGLITYGTGLNLGTNPNKQPSGSTRTFQQSYQGLTYNYAFFSTKMKSYSSTPWVSGGLPAYNQGTNDYMIIRYTGTDNPVAFPALSVLANQKYIILIPKGVSISSDITVAPGGFLALITNSNITFTPTVVNAQGLFLTDGTMTVQSLVNVPADEPSENQFIGQGSFVAWGGIFLNRNRGITNGASPSEQFTYRQNLIDSIPEVLTFPYKYYAPYSP
jgi:hypothetical protein